jgi:hypothetical protein
MAAANNTELHKIIVPFKFRDCFAKDSDQIVTLAQDDDDGKGNTQVS